MRKPQSTTTWTVALCLLMALIGAGLVHPAPAFAGTDEPPATGAEQRSARDLALLQQYWQGGAGGNESSTATDLIGPFRAELLAKAQPDECFNGAGNPYPPGPPCSEGQPKVNQAYVWGLAKSGQTLWFGTAANVLCLVIGGFLGITTPMQTDAFACEFGESPYSQPKGGPLPPLAGDWRPPRIYTYDTVNKTLADRTPVTDWRLTTTLGLRSAMTAGRVAILAGPGLLGGINLFAFNAETGAYLGSTTLPQFTNIRKWLQVRDTFYTGVRNATGGGSVLRWKGDPDTLENLFEFEVVGTLETEVAELALHEGRIFVTTWPELQPSRQASLNMSPVVSPVGLTAADAGNWIKVWQAGDYEPDPVTAATYGGGALASFGGYLYWGTMHVPFTAALAHVRVYGVPEDQAQILATILGSNRAITIFRGKGFGRPNQKIELAYGMAKLPSYSPSAGWELVRNNMNAAPLYGPSGFGNFYNNYTWSMAVFQKELYVGTMDWSYLLGNMLPIIVEYLTGQPLAVDVPFPLGTYGADVWRFPGPRSPALPVSLFGVGNPSSYGVRNMLPDDALYLGMANPMNLLTGDQGPKGGWELLKLETGR